MAIISSLFDPIQFNSEKKLLNLIAFRKKNLTASIQCMTLNCQRLPSSNVYRGICPFVNQLVGDLHQLSYHSLWPLQTRLSRLSKSLAADWFGLIFQANHRHKQKTYSNLKTWSSPVLFISLFIFSLFSFFVLTFVCSVFPYLVKLLISLT